VTRFPGIHGGTTAVVSLKHDKTSQNGRIPLVDSWKTGHSNDPSIWPALKNMSRERAKVDTLVSCVFGMGEHGGSSMPFGWAGDAAWCATLSTRRASTYTGSAAREDPPAGGGAQGERSIQRRPTQLVRNVGKHRKVGDLPIFEVFPRRYF
jgi:hypothetical protein